MCGLHLYPNLESRNLSPQMERNYILTNSVYLCTIAYSCIPCISHTIGLR